MAQLVDFVAASDKPKDWHLYFLRELLLHVADEKPTDRRYQKWLRERKVFDRKLIAFCERLTGIKREHEKPPTLSEVGLDLRESIEKAKKKAEEEAEAARKALQKKPGRDGPPAHGAPGRRAAPVAANPDDELDEEKAFAEKTPEVGAADDLFHQALLERLFELNGYLSKFVFRELADDFLAISELYRRMGTSAYAGRRPSLPQFETWVKWQEWLGGMQKVGFRHRGTPKGKEHGKFYKEVPDAELLAPSKEDELLIELAPAPVAAAPEAVVATPLLVPNAPTGRRSLESSEDDDEGSSGGDDEGEDGDDEEGKAGDREGLAEEEGLELPPETAPPEPREKFWAVRPHDDQAAARGPLPDTVIADPKPQPPAGLASVLKNLTEEAKAIAPPAPPAPAPAPKTEEPKPAPPPPAPKPAKEEVMARTGEVRLPPELMATPPPPPVVVAAPVAPPPPPVAPVAPAAAPLTASSKLSRAARSAGLVLDWWREVGRPGERVTAREAGIDLAIYRGPHRGVLVLKLLALAAFAEADRARAVAFFRELDAHRSFEALLHEEAPLERVLEPSGLLDPVRTLAPFGERLVHLLRFRRALKREGVLDRIDRATDARELARTIRREVTGDSLSTGVVLVIREMARAGHWRASGIDAFACVPWRSAREAAHRLGLLDHSALGTFEDVLAAAEALSRNFRDADEGEVPLLAFAVHDGAPALLRGAEESSLP